ncbi:alpha-N-arabinofuranosidase [Cladophialophora psammophila CBS 110553]|uniref:Alpha-N-arabinofuranosidase n=1 Tax=Cladophialophora psammophila CBS 110553 TaxID=1182543 RepID=W9X770_9EURO|nr:alpha-N-arabinofuranosidase [Cladophialophora psammophila CBS 110553]EXJ76317.1 alpha-N-arabinofuranosidase [Cladophialophora psammophila CBS 110553]
MPPRPPNSNNTFAITFDAAEVAGNMYYFSLVSLFPETFNGRANCIRRDLGQTIVDLGTKILRFPGGNNLQGLSVDQRWKWNETIGPLKVRKGRIRNWGYMNTDGLGLLEYLQFCEDGGIEPVLAVYAGFSLDIWGRDGVSFPEDRMGTCSRTSSTNSNTSLETGIHHMALYVLPMAALNLQSQLYRDRK